MFWFKKKKAAEPPPQPVTSNGSPGKMPSLGQDKNALYSLGTVISVKPPERFDITGEQEGYFVITRGSSNLQINGTIDVKVLGEGEWIAATLLPKTGKHFLSLKSAQEFKLVHLSSASVGGIDTGTRTQIERSLRNLAQCIKVPISDVDSLEQSIGDYVRSSLRERTRSILSQYDQSSFIKKAVNDISSLPTFTQRFIGLTLSESISNAEITAHIKNNPALAGEVLKIVNSSYHGLRNKVHDISYAVLYLGLSQIFQIIISSSLQSITSGSSRLAGVYEHSVIISNVASLLSSNKDRRAAPMVSTIGILHGVGEIVKYHIKERRKDIDFLVDQLSSAKLGSMLLEKWRIPEPICKAIEIQDQSYYTLPEEFDEEMRLYMACLHISHSVFSFVQDGSLPRDPITQAYLSFLGFADMNIEQLIRLYVVPELRNNANKLPIEVQVFFSV